jgi:Flp pilus assembly protein TadG
VRALSDRSTRFTTRFARDEEGAVTVEAVLWIPLFFFLLILITNSALAFYARGEAFRIVQNGNRAYSAHTLASKEAVEAWIEGAFTRTQNDDAVTTISADKTIVTTQLTFPIRDVIAFNSLSLPISWTLTVRSQHYVEWPNS